MPHTIAELDRRKIKNRQNLIQRGDAFFRIMEDVYLVLLGAYFWLNAVILGALMIDAHRKGPAVLFLTVVLTPFIGLPGAVLETLYKHLVYPVYRWVDVTYKPSFYFHFYFGSKYRGLLPDKVREFEAVEKKYRKAKMLKHRMLVKRVRMVLGKNK